VGLSLLAAVTLAATALLEAAVPAGAATPTRTYVMARGDTLWGVAHRFHVSVAGLARANHLRDPDHVRYGTRLTIPPAATSASTAHPVGVAAAALRPHFVRAAGAAGVPVSVLEGLAWQESGWQAAVRSDAGAIGVGQLTADTIAFVNAELLGSRLDPTQAADNIVMSATYLAWLLHQTNGDMRLAVAAYYQGLASVRRDGVSPATAHYVDDVMALSNRFSASG